MSKHQYLAEIAALEATLPKPSPCAHMPYITTSDQLYSVMGRSGAFVIGPEYFMSPRARKSLADIAELEG